MPASKIGPADAAQILGMTRRGVLYLIQAGKLPAERVKTLQEGGNARYFYLLQRDNVEAFQKEREDAEREGRGRGRPRTGETAAASA